MPVVTETITGPDKTPTQYVDVTVRLVASVSGEAEGYLTDADETLTGTRTTRTGSDGVATFDLPANIGINPANTVYEWTRKVPGRPAYSRYIRVPDGAGPYKVEDILTVSPAALADPGTVLAILADDARFPSQLLLSFLNYPNDIPQGTWAITKSTTYGYTMGYRANDVSTMVDDQMTFSVPLKAGTWRLDLFYGQATDAGQTQVLLDDVQIGSTVEGYAAAPAGAVTPITFVVAESLNHTLSFKVTAKNASSSSYRFYFLAAALASPPDA